MRPLHRIRTNGSSPALIHVGLLGLSISIAALTGRACQFIRLGASHLMTANAADRLHHLVLCAEPLTTTVGARNPSQPNGRRCRDRSPHC